MRQPWRCAVSARFFVPLSLVVDESLDRRTPLAVRRQRVAQYDTAHTEMLTICYEVAVALYRPR